MEYKIVSEQTVGKMEISVNNLLNEGWQLSGYLCVSVVPDGMGQNFVKYAQAMVKGKNSGVLDFDNNGDISLYRHLQPGPIEIRPLPQDAPMIQPEIPIKEVIPEIITGTDGQVTFTPDPEPEPLA
jgi:hypothetical protein